MANIEMTQVSAEKVTHIAKTRVAAKCPVFDFPSQMKGNVLPTNADVLRSYQFERNKLKCELSSKEPEVSKVAEIIAVNIEEIWSRASIPYITHKSIVRKVNTLHERFRTFMKSYTSTRKNNASFLAKVEKFRRSNEEELFDIATCRCVDYDKCKCIKEDKIPVEEREFLIDQRHERRMVIGGVDIRKTQQLKRKAERRERQQKYLSISTEEQNTEGKNPIAFLSEDKADVDNEVSDTLSRTDADCSSSSSSSQKRTQMRLELPNLARECDRYGISDRGAASIASSLLQDIGIIHEGETSHVVDRSKIRRERKKSRISAKEIASKNSQPLTGLYFDGRKDATVTQVEMASQYHQRTVQEEHYTLVQEPNSIYIGHITVPSSEAKVICSEMLDFFKNESISLDSLIAVGCDGTNVNTGVNGGVIRLMEEALNRPLQWCICLLHANELPLRHLLKFIDGKTKGPGVFSGPIGKAIQHCENLEVIQYTPITGQALSFNLEDMKLSSDQKYLYDICKAISTGVFPENLAAMKPGPVVHSRWLTTACRILRLYAGTENPETSLIAMVTFIMKVYAPMWFSIKRKPLCTDGPQHIWKMIHLSEYLEKNLKDIIYPVIQRNSFFAHPENILLAMIVDERPHVRQLAYRRIMASRKSVSSYAGVRKFAVPKINFSAKEYFELIEWQELGRCEPPLTKTIPDNEILFAISNEDYHLKIDSPKFPCHTQSTERHVQIVTEAAKRVCGQDQRHGFILAKIQSRNIMDTFNTKSEFSF